MASGLLLAGRRQRLAATHPCGVTGQLRHAAMSSSSSSSSSDGGSQSSDVDEPETTTTTNQSAALSSAVAKASEATEQTNWLQTELSRAKPDGGTHKVWKYYMVYVNTKYKDLATASCVIEQKGTQLPSGSSRTCCPRTLCITSTRTSPAPGRIQRCQAADNPDAGWWGRWVGDGGG